MRIEQLSSDERGAVVLFVAILLVVIFGMVVLVVDVGGLLVLRGRMVTAADSASLAAAQSCASDQGVEAQAKADEVALSNLADVSGVSGGAINSPACGQGSGTVAVSYSGVQELYFAPVLGFDSQRAVSGSATAMWAPSTGAEPIPIVLSDELGTGTPCQSRCAYWYDPDNELEGNTFGFAHLAAWRRFGGAQTSRCPRGTFALPGWISEAPPVEVTLTDTPPGFACSIPRSNIWVDPVQEQVGNSRIFVVNDQAQMPDDEQFAAVGFRPLTIQGLSQGIGEQAIVCEQIEVDSLENEEVIDLTLQVLACLLQYGLDGVEVTVLPEGLDYEFNPITNTFRWLDEAVDNITITIGGTQPADGGECGVPVPDEDPWCLVVSYEGPQVGGVEPNESAIDFGLRAIRLTQDQ